MLICWDNLEGFYLSKNGNFRKGSLTYIYVDKCKVCKLPYLTEKSRPSEYCSHKCVYKSKAFKNKLSLANSGTNNTMYGKKHSADVLNKMSKNRKGKMVGIDNHNYKGGVSKNKLALYETYASKLEPFEEVRLNTFEAFNLVQVKCYKCNEWFFPTKSKIANRLYAINNLGHGECNFYCSDNCKYTCEIFGQSLHLKNNKPRKRTYGVKESDLIIWSKKVLEKAGHKCEICGRKAINAHHIVPKKLEPFRALDLDNGLSVCKNCHYKCHSDSNCTTGYLAKLKCNDRRG